MCLAGVSALTSSSCSVVPLLFPSVLAWWFAERFAERRGVWATGLVAVAALLISTSQATTHIGSGPHAERIAAGAFIQAHTPPDALLLYALPEATWTPESLYYAKRDGFNVVYDEMGDSAFHETRTGPSFHGSELLYLFVPSRLQGNVEPQQRRRWRSVAQDRAGALYAYQPSPTFGRPRL